jgi:hypothetical protein
VVRVVMDVRLHAVASVIDIIPTKALILCKTYFKVYSTCKFSYMFRLFLAIFREIRTQRYLYKHKFETSSNTYTLSFLVELISTIPL